MITCKNIETSLNAPSTCIFTTITIIIIIMYNWSEKQPENAKQTINHCALFLFTFNMAYTKTYKNYLLMQTEIDVTTVTKQLSKITGKMNKS